MTAARVRMSLSQRRVWEKVGGGTPPPPGAPPCVAGGGVGVSLPRGRLGKPWGGIPSLPRARAQPPPGARAGGDGLVGDRRPARRERLQDQLAPGLRRGGDGDRVDPRL